MLSHYSLITKVLYISFADFKIADITSQLKIEIAPHTFYSQYGSEDC